jgi:hypothetical protein
VARALAGNTRAVLQIGHADDISNVLLLRSVLHDDGAALDRDNGHVGGTEPPPLTDGREPQPAAAVEESATTGG